MSTVRLLKQAQALGARLRKKLLDKVALHRSEAVCSLVECVRVTLGRSHLLPPVLQVIGAKLTRDPLFGYKEQDVTRLLPVQKDTRMVNVVIGCGRSTVALCAVMKQLEPKRTFNVQIQHPACRLRGSTLWWYPGTTFLEEKLLKEHGSEWSGEFDEMLQGRRTRFVWLLGGPCRGFAFTEQDAELMVEEFIRALPRGDDVAVLVTFSRRTPQNVQKVIRRCLDARFPMPGQLLVWEGTERRNPYNALLSTASCVVTTPDSISMTTEAIASGKPVFTIGVENCKGKFLRFHQSLFESKATAPFTADAVATVLHDIHEHDVSSGAAAFEKEISTIVDTIATNILTVLKQIEAN
ncbi:Mitochondrial fission protein ELM1-like [Phytophthora cactorum]|nr:Mitochondrial fission protein ELM1-like [Phytophthora cactorum]